MKASFLIGEMAKLFGVSKQTLIYYDRIGLLSPSEIQPNGYRYYSYEQVETLEVILTLKETGMPLGDIRVYLESRDIGRCTKLLEKQSAIIDKKIETLRRTRSKIQTKLGELKKYSQTGLREEPFFVDMPPFTVLSADVKDTGSTDMDVCVAIKQLLDTINDDERLYVYAYRPIGVRCGKEDILARQFNRLRSVFMVVDDAAEREDIVRIAPGRVACIHYTGPYHMAYEPYDALMAFIEENGYEMCGDSIELPLIDGFVVADERDYVTEIQIPVREK